MIDAHVHFWDESASYGLRYPWLEGVPALARTYVPANYPGSAEQLIVVEGNCVPSQADVEVDFLNDLADADSRISGIVAFVNLQDADACDTALPFIAGRKRIIGVRHNIQGQPVGFCLTPAFIAGVTAIGELDLVFDLCCTADQLDDVIELVKSAPGTRFVLDHCGKPSIRTDAFTPWAAAIDRLSQFENVACKVSGLFTESRADQCNASGMHPYVDHVYRAFGAGRLMYGSDWPVATLASGERAWFSTVSEITKHWTLEEQQGFYEDNAVQTYHLRNNG